MKLANYKITVDKRLYYFSKDYFQEMIDFIVYLTKTHDSLDIKIEKIDKAVCEFS
jgi:hypothetical protein